MPRPAAAVLALLLLARLAHGADLTGEVDRLLAAVPQGGRAAVVVFDLRTQQLLYSRNGGDAFAPASVAKLLVGAAALLELGPDWRFTTQLIALGPVQGGAVPGLAVLADGDPCLDTHFHVDPDEPLRAWAAALKAKGVTRIAGDLVIDRSRFSGPERPATYPQDHENQQSWYSAPASAFAWNDNCIEVRVAPGAAGGPAVVSVRPTSSRFTVQNLTRTVPKAKSIMRLVRDDDDSDVAVSGTFGGAVDWQPVAIHHDADLLAGDELRAVLIANGIAMDGAVRPGAAPAGGQVLVEDGHPLAPALGVFLTRSQNFYGEQLLRVLGLRRRHEGSVAAGCAAVGDILQQHLGADVGGYTLIDGCGLSYGNRVCADFLARLLWTMDRRPDAALFRDSLKPMDSGRIKGRVKTGLIAIARTLAGYLERPDGSRVIFAVLLNQGDAKGFGWGPVTREKLFQAICRGIE
jgi:D-alanyl-D-alanine carboxypeptidase/D-alanyl-D-alanine-endopeptidase (penicillin-binding protein 4)